MRTALAERSRHRVGRYSSRQTRKFRQPEVEDLRQTTISDEDVGRFDVPVDDFPRVGFRQSFRHLAGDVQGVV